ncbi:hypothetical protein ACFOWB_24480 [Chenggangzhangella methanolivorans]|uniref:hypothetical protein n=1 Tax=Chenggangzhangella methanolivorans TaxID=1437009 RepID=UPI00360BA4E2
MISLAGPFGPFLSAPRPGARSRVGAVAAAAVALTLANSPASAEVCDKIEEARAGWLAFVALMATVAFLAASAFRKLWPALLAAGLMFFLAAADLYELAIGHPVETAAWAEGCGRTAVALDLLAGCGLLLLGALGLRVAARRAADPSASKRSRT